MSAEYDDPRTSGAIFYTYPDELTERQVDPLIWPAVKRINTSGWVWTGESCQGHPDSDEPLVWGIEPMLRLTCRAERFGEMLCALAESATVIDDHLPIRMVFRICVGEPSRAKWRQILVYIEARCARDRNRGIRMFEQFADCIAVSQ